ncbi:MAG: tRNA lysidine(34) synthetase TilS [Candidatus Coatesbacteria bacterium]|nr:MAG: tRNA lysidine(34) synthetase TilS [Candidatus Coatesbacteria bacterium]
MNPFEERVVEEVKSRRLIDAGARVVCAVSGGPDSVALVRSLAATVEETGINEITVAHFDHRMRPESGTEADWVRELAASLDLGFHSGSADVPALQTCFRRSPEDAARNARRDFLLRVKARAGADAVALGHQMTDRAETFFMNLVRGAGSRGLGAMRWRDDAGFVRPLLWTTKREIIEYLNEIDQAYLEDPTNEDIIYTRNLIRQEIFPVVESNFPGAVRKMAEAADAFAREDDALSELAREASSEYLSENDKTAVLKDAFRNEITPAVAARLVQLAYERLGKRRRTLERAHIESVLTLADGSTANLPGGCSAERSGGATVFRPAPCPEVTSWRVVVPVPGKASVPGVGYTIKVGVNNVTTQTDYAVTLDEEAVGGRLVVRSRKPGDRIRPAGLGGTRKLQDVFVDAKIQRDARVLYPVIASEKRVLSVPRLMVSEDAAPRGSRPTVTIIITCSGANPFDTHTG